MMLSKYVNFNIPIFYCFCFFFFFHFHLHTNHLFWFQHFLLFHTFNQVFEDLIWHNGANSLNVPIACMFKEQKFLNGHLSPGLKNTIHSHHSFIVAFNKVIMIIPIIQFIVSAWPIFYLRFCVLGFSDRIYNWPIKLDTLICAFFHFLWGDDYG